jgi:hypothetical protein
VWATSANQDATVVLGGEVTIFNDGFLTPFMPHDDDGNASFWYPFKSTKISTAAQTQSKDLKLMLFKLEGETATYPQCKNLVGHSKYGGGSGDNMIKSHHVDSSDKFAPSWHDLGGGSFAFRAPVLDSKVFDETWRVCFCVDDCESLQSYKYDVGVLVQTRSYVNAGPIEIGSVTSADIPSPSLIVRADTDDVSIEWPFMGEDGDISSGRFMLIDDINAGSKYSCGESASTENVVFSPHSTSTTVFLNPATRESVQVILLSASFSSSGIEEGETRWLCFCSGKIDNGCQNDGHYTQSLGRVHFEYLLNLSSHKHFTIDSQ